ncbi:MAG: type II secretion system protein, partial [Candidatus Moranbacteria bacterium]|nr:type II secretion system protein [Candidatus Moranbacteria bacterium]
SKKQKNKKGISLLEVIIATAVFVVIMTAVASIFARYSGSFRDARAIQNNMEEAQFAMNLIAKTLRTSTVKNFGSAGKSITVFDYSQSECIEYEFDAGFLYERRVSVQDVDSCSVGAGFGANAKMASAFIDGEFTGIVTDNTKMGFVTILLEVRRSDRGSASAPDDTGLARIQSTVSLRDYGQAGL